MSHRQTDSGNAQLGVKCGRKVSWKTGQPAQAQGSTSPSKEGPQHPQPRPSMKGWYPSPQALYTTDFRLTELQACCRGRKTPPAQSGWTTANTGVPLSAHWQDSMETEVQGSWVQWCGLRSQRRHDIWAAFEFSIFGGFRGAGRESQTGRALHGAPQQVPPGPVSVHWAGDKASHTKGKRPPWF